MSMSRTLMPALLAVAGALAAPHAIAAETVKFIYAYADDGTLISPDNAAGRCPDAMLDTGAVGATCKGVRVQTDGSYSFQVSDWPLAAQRRTVLDVRSYLHDPATDTYIPLEARRRIEQITPGAENSGANVNASTEVAVQGVERQGNTAIAPSESPRAALRNALGSINPTTLNTAVGASRAVATGDEDRIWANRLDGLSSEDVGILAALVDLLLANLDVPGIVEIVRSAVGQVVLSDAPIEPAALTQTVKDTTTQAQAGQPVVIVTSNRYVLKTGETADLGTGSSLNADGLSYTWQGATGTGATARFSRSQTGDYTVCATGKTGTGQETRGCTVIRVIAPVTAVITPGSNTTLPGGKVNLTATNSLGAATYAWSGSGSFSSTNSATTAWIAPGVPGIYSVTLRINGSQETDTTVFMVVQPRSTHWDEMKWDQGQWSSAN